jgi:hypothetical protein
MKAERIHIQLLAGDVSLIPEVHVDLHIIVKTTEQVFKNSVRKYF